jgi:hypothetical protein
MNGKEFTVISNPEHFNLYYHMTEDKVKQTSKAFVAVLGYENAMLISSRQYRQPLVCSALNPLFT